jgi:hypothetical protein
MRLIADWTSQRDPSIYLSLINTTCGVYSLFEPGIDMEELIVLLALTTYRVV